MRPPARRSRPSRLPPPQARSGTARSSSSTSRTQCEFGPESPARPRSRRRRTHRDKGITTMKKFGLQKLTGLALAAMLAGGVLAPAAFAQEAAPAAAMAAEAAPDTAAAPAPVEAAPAAAPEEVAEPALDTGDTSWV